MSEKWINTLIKIKKKAYGRDRETAVFICLEDSNLIFNGLCKNGKILDHRCALTCSIKLELKWLSDCGPVCRKNWSCPVSGYTAFSNMEQHKS
jgi:hypothetical protein